MLHRPSRYYYGETSGQTSFILVNLILTQDASLPAIGHGEVAEIIQRCVSLLKHARAHYLRIAFVIPDDEWTTASGATNADWIGVLKPRDSEAVFRSGQLCYYTIPYFEEYIYSGDGRMILAGLPKYGGCLATMADAASIGHGVTLLNDAILDHGLRHIFGDGAIGAVNAFTKFEITVMDARSWLSSICAVCAGKQQSRREPGVEHGGTT